MENDFFHCVVRHQVGRGRKVKYQDVSTKMFLKAAKAQGVSDFEIAHIGFYFDEAHDSPDWREAAEQKELLLLPTSRLSIYAGDST